MTADHVRALKSLHQAAAAWLLGCSTRVLRDRTDIARNLDGTYSARGICLAAARSPTAFCRHDAELLRDLTR